MPLDRATALAELNDPATLPARLMEIAAAHPELGDQVIAHPNVYPDLVAWVHSYGGADEGAEAATAATDAALAEATPAAAATAVGAGAPAWVLPTALGAGALLVTTAVAAGFLVVPGLLSGAPGGDVGQHAADFLVAAVPAGGSYRDGLQLTWTNPGELGDRLDVESTAYNNVFASDLGDAWVTWWPTTGSADTFGFLHAVDAVSGETLWTRDESDLSCLGAIEGIAYCVGVSDEIVLLDARTGDDTDGPLRGTSAEALEVLADGVVIATTAPSIQNGYDFTFERRATNGELVWGTSVPCHPDDYWDDEPYPGAQLKSGELVIQGSCFSGLLDPETGELLAHESWMYYGEDYPSLFVDAGVVATEGAEVVVLDGDPQSTAVNRLWSVAIDRASSKLLPRAITDSPTTPVIVFDLETGAFSRIDPAPAPVRVDSMPAELPDCPAGWTPVAWSAWEGGATLVCQAGDASVAVLLVRGDDQQWSTSTAATPTGYQASFADTELEFGLDGWVVWVDGTATVSSAGWTSLRGEISYPGATDIASCPKGSFALSLSVWNGGWLLTCGLTAASPTSFAYLDGSTTGSGTALTPTGNRYCGETDDGERLCVSASPALVEFGSGAGATQHSVTSNYFAQAGSGGAGEGTGAYGVEAPDATAEAQVAYLVAILEKSASARATVNAVLAPLNSCSVSSGDVDALRGLTQARTDLLSALQSTPVDQVPDGSRLLSLLRSALQLSEEADQGYVDAAITMTNGGCTSGRATYNSAIAVANQAEAAKQAFVDAWNASIPSRFGVRSFTARDI